MSNIDWSKPLQMKSYNRERKIISVESINHGAEYIVKHEYDHKEYTTVWTRDGRILNQGWDGNRIENVPEEPYDTLILYRVSPKVDWDIDRNGPFTHPVHRQVFQRKSAETLIQDKYRQILEQKLVTIDPVK